MKSIKTFVFLISVFTSFNVCAADQSICNSGSNVLLHNNGSVKACQLETDYVANNIRCKSDSPVSFYNNGNLESCVLATEATIADNKCEQDTLISFYMDGKLKACMKPD
jgi:hypothetical protein